MAIRCRLHPTFTEISGDSATPRLRTLRSAWRVSLTGQQQSVCDAAQIPRKQPSAGESHAPLGGVVWLDSTRGRMKDSVMDRRTFIGAMVAGIIVPPLAASAQTAT